MSIDVISLPLIGAFIGYFTNYVAIKMLFYPKKPYYIAGVRLPFTPGLIPKKRDELIDKISSVVAEKVINKRELIKYIYSKKNREFLYSYTNTILENLLSKKLSEISVPYKKIEDIVYKQLTDAIEFFAREKLNNFNLDFNYITYNAFLLIDKNKKIKELIPKEHKLSIYQNLENLSLQALTNLKDSLDDPAIKELIKNKITESLNDYIDESNILTASFVSMIAPLIEENEKITEIVVDKLKKILMDRNVKVKVINSIKKAFEREIMDLSLEQFLIKYANRGVEDLRIYFAEKLKEIFEKLNLKEKIIREIINSIDKKKLARRATAYLRLSLSRITFKDVLKFLKPEFEGKMARYIVNNLLIIIRQQSERIFDFDIAENARKRLKSLDIGQVEDIILNISKEQFKYINLFGGILGFLIGIIEVIMR